MPALSPSLPGSSTRTTLPSHAAHGRVGEEELLQHFMPEAKKAGVELLRLGQVPEFGTFRSLVTYMDASVGHHAKVRKDGEKQPYYMVPASLDRIQKQLIEDRGVLPLFSFDRTSNSPTGAKVILGVRTHDLGGSEINYARLRNPEELIASLLNEVLPNLHHYMGLTKHFTIDQVSFVMLPNEDFDRAAAMISNQEVRRDFLKVIDGRANPNIVFREILMQAMSAGSSDIHIEPASNHLVASAGDNTKAEAVNVSFRNKVRIRVDGDMMELDLVLDSSAHERLVRAIGNLGHIDAQYLFLKRPADFDIKFEQTHPQMRFTDDASKLQFTTVSKAGEESFFPEDFLGHSLRVSRAYTNNGPAVVMRILKPASSMVSLDKLNIAPHFQEILEMVNAEPKGLLLFTGPTGSGKTSLQYTIMRAFADPRTKVITLEEPIEQDIPGLEQLDIDAKHDAGFAAMLRRVLRRDPDKIMVGEIRDTETAELSIGAAETGHLLYSTLHTNDAPSAFTRLQSLGSNTEKVSSYTRAVIAQRLVKRLAKVMSAEGPVLDDSIIEVVDGAARLNKLMGGDYLQGEVQIAQPKPMSKEEFLRVRPYQGRLPIMEILTPDDRVRSLIYNKASEHEIRRQARDMVYNPYVEHELDGLRLVLNGETSLDELVKVTGPSWFRRPDLRNAIIKMVELSQIEEENGKSILQNNANLGELLRGCWKEEVMH